MLLFPQTNVLIPEVRGIKMLHITNGESAAIRIQHTGIAGEVLALVDVLHDGPTPRQGALQAPWILTST